MNRYAIAPAARFDILAIADLLMASEGVAISLCPAYE